MIIETIILNIISSILLDTSKFSISKIKDWNLNKEIVDKDLILKTLDEFNIKIKNKDKFIKQFQLHILQYGSELNSLEKFWEKNYPSEKINVKDFYYSLAKKAHNLLKKDEYFKSFVMSNLSSISSQILYLSQFQEQAENIRPDLYFLLETLSSLSQEIKNSQDKMIDDQRQLMQTIIEYANKIENKYNSLEIIINNQNEMQKNFFEDFSGNVENIYPKIEEKSKVLELYKKQVLKRYGKLEFLGMPDFREKPKIELEKIFVPLRSAGIENSDVKLTQLFSKNRKIVILGDPGSGKTTLSKYIAITHINENALSAFNIGNQIPILITLRSYANALGEKGYGYSISQYILDHLKEDMNLEMDANLLQYYLSIGACIVILDGLDELTHTNIRFKIKKIVESFSISYPLNFYVVTSRIVGYSEASLDAEEFEHYTIRPFSLEEIEVFINSWYDVREDSEREKKEKKSSLMKAIESNDGVKRLATNPLMLTIIALVHRIEAELPNERVKLYDRCTEALISTWEKYKGASINIGDTVKRRRLEKIAYKMHSLSKNNNEQVELKSEQLKLILKEILLESEFSNEEKAEEEVEEFIDYIRKRIGILVEKGHGIYGFVHLTFEEYFAACDILKRYISDLDNMWKVIEEKIINSQWNEVMLLLMGKLGEFDEPVNKIVQRIIAKKDIRYDSFLIDILRDNVHIDQNTKIEIMSHIISYSFVKYDLGKYTTMIQEKKSLSHLYDPLININRISNFPEFWDALSSKISNKNDFLNFYRNINFINNVHGLLGIKYFLPSAELRDEMVKFKGLDFTKLNNISLDFKKLSSIKIDDVNKSIDEFPS